MKRKSNILLIILIVSSLFLMFIPKSVKGSIADVNYYFENDVYYNSDDSIISYTNTFNVRNPTNFTDLYYGTYSFVNETGLQGTNIDWVDLESSYDGGTEVINDLDGHSEVLQFQDDITGGENPITQHNFTQRTSGIFEFWMRTNNGLGYWQLSLIEGLTTCERLRVAGNDIWYTNTAPAWVNIQDFYDNTWYHINFEWRADNTWDLYINNQLVVNNIALENNQVAGLTHIELYAGGSVADYLFIDAYGENWNSSYSKGQNNLPEIIIDTSILEMDKYEFALQTNNTLYPIGYDSPSGWTDVEPGAGDLVNILADTNDINDRVVEIGTNNFHDIKGLVKDDFGITENYINITMGFNITTMTGITSYNLISIYSSDLILLLGMIFYHDGSLEFYDGVGNTDLRLDLAINTYYEFNLLLDYERDITILRWFINGVFDDSYLVPMGILGKNGLGEIHLTSYWSDDYSHFLVDYVGVYSNGLSVADNEYAWTTVDFGGADWDLRYHNLYTIKANGLIHISSVEGVYVVGMTASTVSDFRQFYNISTFVNGYDGFIAPIVNPTFVFTFNGSNFNVYNITIEGVRLKEGSNVYYLTYTHDNIDTSESYFYVDSNNRLQFSLITNDTNTEYIQATFNITDLSSTDKGLSFKGSKTDLAYGYFVVDYLVGVSTVDIPIFEKTTRAILPSNKTIETIGVLISDNNVDSIIGTTTGFVSKPKFLAISGIGFPIITSGLIEMMIPLIMIMIPTLLISQGFGKEGKKLIVPLFFMFSLITTATLIIPVWIFFIIIFGTGLFLAKNKEIEGK